MVIFIDKMAAKSSSLKFVDSHNMVGYLLDPSVAHKEFQSIIAGLNSCRISQALRANPVICKDMITDFWNNASVNKQGANGAGTVESMVKGTKVIICEQTIREVLEFGDAPEFPIEYSLDRVREVLEKMCYEGSYPPTTKKLLPPYWRFLAHTFVSCISGRKGGSDEISQTATSAIVALIMDWDYNFSRFVFEEMKSNLLGKKKDLFLMYPRFLQMIFDKKYSQIERTPDTLVVRAMGPHTFGHMKQSRKYIKVAYQGLKELVKFGKFSEKEEVHEAPVIDANLGSSKPKFQFSIEEVEISDDEENQLTKQEFEGIIQQNISTPEQGEAVTEVLQQIALNPPQSVFVAVNEPAESDLEESASALFPRKRKRRNPRPGVLITDQSLICEESQIVEEEVVPTEVVQVARSSFIPTDISKGKSKLPESELLDVVKLQKKVFDLEQDSAEKELMIGKLDIRISELEKDNSEKNSKISELQANIGGLTTLFFDLKQRLFQKFGDEFQSLGDEGEKASTSSSSPTGPVPQPSSEGVTRTDEYIDQYLSTGPNTAEERRKKQRKINQQRLKRDDLLIMKNSDENIVSSNRPEMYVHDVGKRFFVKYGDRSGIRVWGFDDDREMWYVKRKSGNVEYYTKKVYFMSWMKIDLSELLQAPFHNPSNDPNVWAFKSFLEDQTH